MAPHRAYPQRGTDPLPVTAPDRRSFRRNYLDGNAFEWWLGLAAIVGSTVQFLDLDALFAASIGQQVGDWAIVWNGLYFFGGVMIVCGLWVPSLRVELAGLCLFFAAVMVNASAVLSIFGTRGIAVTLAYLAFGAAAWRRGMLVLRIVRRHEEANGG